ncbi:MAG: hypothetical protein FIA92_16395 [Chloroflexi bacterium]|nr:hypothetical protein [Chloroflexota bacterium]
MRVHPAAAGPGPLVVVVGAASRDLAIADARGWRLGGAVAYGALTLARLGLRVRAIVGLDAEAAAAEELELLDAVGVELTIVGLPSGPVFENIETPSRRRQRCIALSARLPRTRMADGHPLPDAVLFAPVAGEIGDEWLEIVPPGAFVAVGLQGLLRDLRPGAEVRRIGPQPSALLSRADLVSLSRDDLPPDVGIDAVTAIARPDATVILTASTRGGEAFRVGPAGAAVPAARYRAVPADQVVDQTGAGDVFLAAMLACRLVPSLVSGGGARLARELRFAAAAASLAVEVPGILGGPDLDAVRGRLTRARSRASRWARADSSRGSGRPSQA